MRDDQGFPQEHEVWPNEGHEDLPSYKLARQAFGRSHFHGPSQDWLDAISFDAAIYSLQVQSEEVLRMLEKNRRSFRVDAPGDIRRVIARLQRVVEKMGG